jgi:glucose-6-phosphate isomerase
MAPAATPDSSAFPLLHGPLAALPQWQAFTHAVQQAPVPQDTVRTIQAGGITLDCSAQHHSPELQNASEALLQACNFTQRRQSLLNGGQANITEGRAAWHTQLRARHPIAEVAQERERVRTFIENADTAYRWRSIVHIGIGGSDWGVRLAVAAFGYAHTRRQVRFVSNIDGHAMQGGLAGLDPRDTLIVVASKSFSTAETLQNGQRAIEWLQASGIAKPFEHVVAITANPDRARAWGVPDHHIFKLWDWVGGRYSMWSAVSLTTGLAVGHDVVDAMAAGACAMDEHFMEAPVATNAPVQMALSGVANRSVLGFGSLNIAPYDFRLTSLVPYIQQLDMESLGKSVNEAGDAVGVPTGPAIWGMPGTDAQHTFFQWLHQGSDGAPVDFIVCQYADHGWQAHHRSLIANCLAQREAMLKGKSYQTALKECLASGMEPNKAAWLARHRVHPGGRPSNLIVLPRLTPHALGALVALYEHKVFVQGLIWGINPFDQWGVEYGKVLAGGIQSSLASASPTPAHHDASTAYWINTFAR